MQTEQQRQGLGHGRVVIDDEYGAHAGMLSGHPPRVARAGGMDAARSAGHITANCPSSRITRAPKTARLLSMRTISKLCTIHKFNAMANAMPTAAPAAAIRKFSV